MGRIKTEHKKVHKSANLFEKDWLSNIVVYDSELQQIERIDLELYGVTETVIRFKYWIITKQETRRYLTRMNRSQTKRKPSDSSTFIFCAFIVTVKSLKIKMKQYWKYFGCDDKMN